MRPQPNGDGRSTRAEAGAGEGRDGVCAVRWTHRLRFTRDAFAPENPTVGELLAPADGDVRDVLVVIDAEVVRAWPALPRAVGDYAAAHGLVLGGPPLPVPGGEAAKNGRAVVDRILRAVHEAGLCRRSTVVAVGGGAVLDAVGFATSIAHRGLRLLRLPTTTLSQADSGVGVKNGINAFGKKNFLGTFAPPAAVVNDGRFLETLSDRDWRCGFAEAVKVALVKDAALFEAVERRAEALRRRDADAAGAVIRRSALLHLDHIVSGGDPFELGDARPLDFGHWSAHKLEQMTGFALRHGEAVAVGVALDVVYCRLSGWIAAADADRVLRCLRGLGLPVYDAALEDVDTLLEGLDEFREHLGGRLTLPMLRGVGDAFDVEAVDRDRVRRAVAVLAAPAASTASG